MNCLICRDKGAIPVGFFNTQELNAIRKIDGSVVTSGYVYQPCPACFEALPRTKPIFSKEQIAEMDRILKDPAVQKLEKEMLEQAARNYWRQVYENGETPTS